MQQLRCIPKRIGFAVIAVLIVVAGAHAGDIALFDGKSVAAVVYEQTDGVPIAKANEPQGVAGDFPDELLQTLVISSP